MTAPPADDPRHGTPAGYLAHRRAGQEACLPCSTARRRQAKGLALEHLSGARMLYTRDEVDAVLEPWLTLGLGHGAVALAAGLGWQAGGHLAHEAGPVRRGTYEALAAVTEADLHPRSLVWADLTRTRIYSLMAAGHLQGEMPINPRGTWRNHTKITVGLAAAIRDHYDRHQHRQGPGTNTAGRARSAGHVPPAAWDDPGTLAWPLGWTTPLTAPDADGDEVVVHRILAGDWHLPANHAERVAVVAHWRRAGRSLTDLQRLTGWDMQHARKRYSQPADLRSAG